jgi:hypothetical protein
MNMQWAPVMLIVLSLGCSHAHKEEADEGGETKLTLDAVPTAARAALIREAQGAAITTVDKEESNGKVIYETDVMLNGKNWEIKVDPDGKLVSKKLDPEAGEKDEPEKQTKSAAPGK